MHNYSVQRCDRITSAWSLETRVPFLDKRFVNYCLNLHPQIKQADCFNGVEKFILRSAFDDQEHPYLPKDVLWRAKEEFGDGVGSGWID